MNAKVAILMGSESDWPVMKKAALALEKLGITFEARVLSAHRTPREAVEFAETAAGQGIRVLICGAGGAAHLAGVMAAHTLIPVIGVPISSSPLCGEDALFATVQMPQGVPVATVAIDGAWNAGILAAQILGAGGGKEAEVLREKLVQYRDELCKKVLAVSDLSLSER